ncbi:MAG: DUF58 domain-containing protein [Pseudomonadota bacterium]|nr:DUF58 domain-containing protein [Pseudomonadota bacterium]
MLTAEELRQIRRLQVQAGRRVDSLLAGDYRSAFKGSGMEFEEVRQYVPGDDVRRIDWNVTARTGEAWIKEFREERELTLLIMLDVSGSVRFGSGGRDGRTDKRLQMARTAGGLAYAALRTGDRVGLLSFSDRIHHYLPPRRSRGHGWQVISAAFEHVGDDHGTDIAGALAYATKVLRRRAVVAVLSDFHAARPFATQLGALVRRHKTHALLFHDPREATMPPVGLLTLRDAETGAVRVVDAAALHAARSVDARLAELRRQGVRASAVSTSEDAFLRLQQHFRGAR